MTPRYESPDTTLSDQLGHSLAEAGIDKNNLAHVPH
jgi:hypothetical protein